MLNPKTDIYYREGDWDHNNRFNPKTSFCDSQAHAGFPMPYAVVFILCSIVSDKRWLFKLSFHTLTLKIKRHAIYFHGILINKKGYNLLDRPFNLKAMENFSHEKQISDIFFLKDHYIFFKIWPTFLVEICRVKLLNFSFQIIFISEKNTLTSRTIAGASECCLTPSRQFCSYITTRTMYFLTRWEWCLFCTRPKRLVGFKLTDRHVARHEPHIMAGVETTNICPFSVMMRA
jgi:hypothetical protein